MGVTVGSVQYPVLQSGEARAATAVETASSFATENGCFVDDATGSVSTIERFAVEGERTGEQLHSVSESDVAFWVAGAVFEPGTPV